MSGDKCYQIFDQSIKDYHVQDKIEQPFKNPYTAGTIEHLLYKKNWIDTVQWHLEDVIRKPDLDTTLFIQTKRHIDKSNQERTDTVEQIDDWFLEYFKDVQRKPEARMNSETPAWLIDRMSILCLKVYHMREQTERTDATEEHIKSCRNKLAVLLEQKDDMKQCLDELIEDIEKGDRYMKVYRQMKMYNDDELNPVLRGQK